MSQHVLSVRTNINVFIALMVLLVLTIAIAYLDLGNLGLAIAMLIASAKAVLILLFFMHIRFSTPLTWVFASAALFWLAIMFGLTLNDYLTRGWLALADK